MFQHSGVLSNLPSQFAIVRLRRRIERDRAEAHRLAGLRIDEARAALRAVIEAAEVAAIEADAVDHAGLEIGDQELLVEAVIRDVAERGAGVLPIVQPDHREQHRLVAIRGVELVDRAGAAAAEHAGHPLRIVRGPMQAERGGGGDVDVRGSGIVERDAEHLAGFCGGDRVALRLVDPVLALRRLTRIAQVEDAADGALGIDRRAVGPGHGAGEAGGEGFAGLQALRQAGAGGEGEQQQSGGADELHSTFGKVC